MTAEAGSDGPFVGRQVEAETLRRHLEDLRAGHGGATLLVGETGVGKSRLVAAIAQEARERRLPLFRAQAAALDDPPPFSLLRAAVESIREDPAAGNAGAPPFSNDPVLIGFVPRAGDLEPAVPVGIEQRLLDALSGAEAWDASSQERAMIALADRFAELAHHGPVVLILDDVHRADEPSLAAVEVLADRLRNEPVWILATSRAPSSLSAQGRSRLEEFEKVAHARRVALRPFTREEVAQYLRVREPSVSFSEEEVARRFSETGGNPLLLQQLDRRAPAPSPARGPSETDIASLPPEDQKALEVASVLGPEFRFPLFLRASGEQDEERFAEVVDELVERGFLLERPGEVLAFPEDRLREATYGRLSAHRRETLHWSVGEALEASGSAGVATTYALAHHFYLGRARKKAVHYNRMAAEIADRARAPEVARTHLLRALECVPGSAPGTRDPEAELVLELARVTEELGHLPEAERVLREFLERARTDPELSLLGRAGLEVFLSRVLAAEGEMPAALEVAQKVLDTPGLERQPLIRLGGHHHVAMVLYYQGKYAEALAHHTEEVRLAHEVGEPRLLLLARIWRLADLAMMGPTEAVVAEARQVTELRDQQGSPRESAQAHLVLGDLLADARCTPAQRAEALEQYAEAIRFAEEAGDLRRIGWAQYKTAELLRENGRLDEAEEKARAARDLLTNVGDQAGRSLAVKVLGQVAQDRGKYDEAAQDLDEAYRSIRRLNRRLEEMDVLLCRAKLSAARGDHDDVGRHISELERMNLAAARPDLVGEFEKLKQSLRVTSRARDAP